MKRYLHLLLIPVLIACGGVSARAQTVAGAPDYIDYQGKLLDASGDALSPTNPTNYKVYFRIWDVQEGGAATNLIWAEKQIVTVLNGEFSVRLGEGEVIGAGEAPFTSGTDDPRPPLANAFNGRNRYLGVSVGANVSSNPTGEISPRLAFLSSPFSLVSQRTRLADEVNGKVTATTGSSMTGTVNMAGATITGGTFSGGSFSGTTYAGTTITASTGFVGPGTIPVGGIIMWSGANAPAGWQLCDGTNGTPDLRGRFVLGSGANPLLTERTVGQSGGEESHTLTEAEMPSHNHNASGSTASAGAHTHTYSSGHNGSGGISNGDQDSGEMGRFANVNTTSSSGAHTHTFNVNTSFTGSGAPHNNLPPYYVLAFIMRIQ